MNNCYGTGFATYVNQLDSKFFPIQENGGIGGITSTDGKNNIDRWLSTSPAKYVSIAYGTNDAWGNQTGTVKYYENTKYMIDAILEAGKIPVLPKIPASTNADVKDNVPLYNAMIDKLYEEYGDRLVQGPDFEAFFTEHPEYLSSDGVHPESTGYDEMRKLWAETMYENVYTAEENQPDVRIMGDVNFDGEFNISDAVAMQKYLIGAGTLTDWKAGDFNFDDSLDVFDLCLMKEELVSENKF
jgi:lysophospholipase L1-like esterase